MSLILDAALVTVGILGALLAIGAAAIAVLTVTHRAGRTRPAHWLRAHASIRRQARRTS